MKRTISTTLAVAMCAAIAVPSAMAAGTVNGKFDGFNITLSGGAKASGSNGKATTKAGPTTFSLVDTSNFHNFVLEKGAGNPNSPKPVKATNGKAVVTDKSPKAVAAKPGTQKFTVNLTKGKYTLYCQPHFAQGMKVTITVT